MPPARTSADTTDEGQQELAQVGAAEFILDYAWGEDTVEDAMSECIADTADQVLNPDDSTYDGSDDEDE